MAEAYLPAHMVTTGQGIPPRCCRHGLPATKYDKVSFVSRTPVWVWIFVVISLLIALVIALALRKTLRASQWPLCAECLDRRRQMHRGAWAAVGIAVLLFVAAGVLESGWPALGGLVAALAMCIFLSQTSWAVIVHADVTSDGQALRLRDPDQRFLAELPPAPPAPMPHPSQAPYLYR